MVKVEFLGPIAQESLEIDISNLNQLSDILKKDDDLKQWLECSAVAVNDSIVKSRDINLNNGDKISLLPPVCGG
jgi:molybdopterin synthase sulfur carrier subunit